MARKLSAGTVLYRVASGTVEVLLVHPSGAYNRHTPWGIPKGYPEEGESALQAARRETREETGIEAGQLTDIGTIKYRKSRKIVHAFAGPAPANATARCASWEVDGAAFMPVSQAVEIIHPDQLPFLERLAVLLNPTPQ